MSLPKYGEKVRGYRRELGVTLAAMASHLGTSAAFLSAMETGRNKIPKDWVEKVGSYFHEKGASVDLRELKILASEANNSVSLEDLPPHHRMLVAGFANSSLSQDQLTRFGELLEMLYSENKEVNDGKHENG